MTFIISVLTAVMTAVSRIITAVIAAYFDPDTMRKRRCQKPDADARQKTDRPDQAEIQSGDRSLAAHRVNRSVFHLRCRLSQLCGCHCVPSFIHFLALLIRAKSPLHCQSDCAEDVCLRGSTSLAPCAFHSAGTTHLTVT